MKKFHLPFTILPAIILLCLTISCQSQQDRDNIKAEEEEMKAEKEMKALADKDVEAWSKGNISWYDEILSPEFVMHGVDSEDIIGIEANKENVTSTRTGFPDFNATIDELIIKGDNFVARWTVTGTNTGPFGDLQPTGKKIKISGVTINHVEDGKISESWMFFNQATMLTQLGFTITPPEVQIEQ